MIGAGRGPLLSLVKVGNDAPIILLGVEDEHFSRTIRESSRSGPKATEQDDGFRLLRRQVHVWEIENEMENLDVTLKANNIAKTNIRTL